MTESPSVLLPAQTFGHRPRRNQVDGKTVTTARKTRAASTDSHDPLSPFAELKATTRLIEKVYKFLSEPQEQKFKVKDGAAALAGTDERCRSIYDFDRTYATLIKFSRALNRINSIREKISGHSGVNQYLTAAKQYLERLTADITNAQSHQHENSEYNFYRLDAVLGTSKRRTTHERVVLALSILTKQITEMQPLLEKCLEISQPGTQKRKRTTHVKFKKTHPPKIIGTPSEHTKPHRHTTRTVFDFANILLKIVSNTYNGILEKIHNTLQTITTQASQDLKTVAIPPYTRQLSEVK